MGYFHGTHDGGAACIVADILVFRILGSDPDGGDIGAGVAGAARGIKNLPVSLFTPPSILDIFPQRRRITDCYRSGTLWRY